MQQLVHLYETCLAKSERASAPKADCSCSRRPPCRSSITRLSVDDKAQRSKEVSSQERDLLTKAVVEAIPEGRQSDAGGCREANTVQSEGNLNPGSTTLA